MEKDLASYYRTLLSKKSEFWSREGQRRLQEFETQAARSRLTGSGVHLAGLLGLHAEWNIRLPTLGMLECYEEACHALSISPSEPDFEEIEREAEVVLERRVAATKQFATDRLSRHGGLVDWLALAEQTGRRALTEFRREIALKKLEIRNRGKSASLSNKVFLVHGHDHRTRDKVVRFLKSMGLVPIVLGRRPAKGRTLIEKLEQEGDVSFALILMTADDLGANKRSPTDLRPRARQNVILELGYFVGRLGRPRVIPLYEDGVEVPTDYRGVEYVSLNDQWKVRLTEELAAAGLPLDLRQRR